MKKGVLILLVVLLIFLAGCGKSNIDAAVVGVKKTTEDAVEQEEGEIQDVEETPVEAEPEKTAGEMMDDLKDSTEVTPEVKTGTFYGEMEVTSTGKDALKEKTKALFKREFFNLSVEADRQFGQRFTYE